MSAYQANRYGRTARPKAPNNQDGNYVTGAVVGDLTSIGAGTNAQGVYKTENQRYMHLISSGSNSGFDKVYAYTYAAANWSELVAVDPSDSANRDSIICGANQHIIVDIKGVDLVAVVTGSSAKLTYQNFIAFSTF